MNIIGLTGLPGSGKSYLANLLEADERFKVIRLGTYLRTIKKTFSNQELIQLSGDYKKNLKTGSIIECFEHQIQLWLKENKIIIIDSVRTKEDIFYLKDILKVDYRLLLILANADQRRMRILNRGRKADPVTLLEIERLDCWEMNDFCNFIFLEVTDYYINNSTDDNKKFRSAINEILSQ